MSKRLSDERLRVIAAGEAVGAAVVWKHEAEEMARELLALRAAGPVMPEQPSDAALHAIQIAFPAADAIYARLRAQIAEDQQ